MRVMTWNLWWRFGPWRERQPAIAAELSEVDADVVLLQEVFADPTEDVDQARDLADGRGFDWVGSVAGRADDPSAVFRARFGNAILSRWPILTSAQLALPGPDGRPSTRTALWAVLDHPAGPQPVVTTHLDWRYDASLVRQRQLDALVRWIADRWSELGVDVETAQPVVLGGDLNAVPESDELRRLTGLAAPYGDPPHDVAPGRPGIDAAPIASSAGPRVYTDAWAACGDGPGHTWTRDNPHSEDAQWPRRRLDYLLVSWPRPKPTGNPRRCWLAGVEPRRGVIPSDHAAVVAEFDDRPPFPTL